MTHFRNPRSGHRRPGSSGNSQSGNSRPTSPDALAEPAAGPDPDGDPGQAARTAQEAREAGEAALRAGQTLNAGRWFRLARTLLSLERDLEMRARKTDAAAASPVSGPGFSPDAAAFERACELDAMAIVLAREAGEPEPEPRYAESIGDADFYLRLRAARRAGLFDEEAHRRGELDLDELDLDPWLPPACRRSPTPPPSPDQPGTASGSD